jgi:glucokinase
MKENMAEVNMILAGDIGGTKTLLGLFERTGARPSRAFVREFATPEFKNLSAVIRTFLADATPGNGSIGAAAFGVAGPVLGSTAELTNVDFTIDAGAVGRDFAIPHVRLVNDLVALAYSVPLLEGDELETLQEGQSDPHGNMAVIAAGTGLGQALLHRVGERLIPSPTEGGHADWAARNDRDVTVLRGLTARFGRAEVEHVISGMGIANLHRITHEQQPCPFVVDDQAADVPALTTKAAMERKCRGCMEALDVFVNAYGAEASNLALRSLATGGLFVGGGIAPKILPALEDGRFLRAFRDKGTFRDLVSRIPVRVILNPDAGLLGAAVAATG